MNMKRTLTLALVSALLVPQLVFAAWWNPFSWFNNWSFSSKNTAAIVETKISEKPVNELEQKSNDITNSMVATSTSTTTKTTVSITKKVEVVKNKPIQNKIIIPAQNVGAVIDYEKSYQDLLSRYLSLRDVVKNNGAVPFDSSSISLNYTNYLTTLLISLNSDIGEIEKFSNINPKPTTQIKLYESKYEKIHADYTFESKSYNNYLNDTVNIQKSQADANAKALVIQQCVDAKNDYKISTDQKFSLQGELNSKQKILADTGNLVIDGRGYSANSLLAEYNLKFAPVDLAISKAQRDISLYCSN